MKFQIPSDFSDQIRRELEKQIADTIRKAGIPFKKVEIDSAGKLRIDCEDADLPKIEQLLEKMR
jgi:hypothetical protein